MRLAMSTVGERKISYINAHGTSTPVGDIAEIEAVRRIFLDKEAPYLSSTKSITGHSLGATGVQEAIYCLLMINGDFISPSVNIFELDPLISTEEVITSRLDEANIDTVLSNSFGFGGTNATLALSKFWD